MDTYKTEPRRFEPRLTSNLSSILISKGRELTSTIINLSENGIGLIANSDIDKGQMINVFLGPNEVPLELKVNVCYCREMEDKYYIGGQIKQACSGYGQLMKLLN